MSKVSAPSSPMRLLQRVRLLGLIGASVCRYTSSQKYCQYGLSIQLLTTASSEAAKGLRVQQARDQPRRQRGATAPRVEVRAERAFDLAPVEQACQANEHVTHVDQLIESRDEQLVGLGCYRLRSHRPNLVGICKETTFYDQIPCKFCTAQTLKSPTKSKGWRLFRADRLVSRNDWWKIYIHSSCRIFFPQNSPPPLDLFTMCS